MGMIQHVGTGERRILEAEYLVGRSPIAGLSLPNTYVSAQHAVIRWTGTGWELKDLGSRNGTTVQGSPVRAGQSVKLAIGARICFGHDEQLWELVDDFAPLPMVVSLDHQNEPIAIEGGLLALPTENAPEATVLRQSDGLWQLEREATSSPLHNGQVFEVAGLRWRFSSPSAVTNTSAVEGGAKATSTLDASRLEFAVSSDEEHVELTLVLQGRVENLGSRAHNYLLLTLARQRIRDQAAGLPSAGSGWIYRDDLLSALKLDRERLNIDIFRIRRQFGALGLSNAAAIVERRPGSQQLRIGVSELVVRRI